MSWFNQAKDQMPELPQEVSVPKPPEMIAYAPPKARIPAVDSIDSTIRSLQELGAKLQASEERNTALVVALRVAETENDQLRLRISEVENREDMALKVRDEALREALFKRGKLAAIRDIVEDDAGETVPLPPKESRRKARGARNGDHQAPATLEPEKLTSDTPKPAEGPSE